MYRIHFRNLQTNISSIRPKTHMQTNYLLLIINDVYYHAVKPNAFRIDYPVF